MNWTFALGVALGLVVGGSAGLVTAALLFAARDEDDNEGLDG